jgi:prepilin-type N-terminal cleavage/methylation domain-containing protein
MEDAEMVRRKKGFTLVELLAVIAIIGILAGFIFAAVSSSIEKAKVTKTRATINTLAVALTNYERDMGSFEAKLQNGDKLPTGDVQTNPNAISNARYAELFYRLLTGKRLNGTADPDVREDPNWSGPYWDPNVKELKQHMPVDSWGKFLIIKIKRASYDATLTHKPDSFQISSCGRDERDDTYKADDNGIKDDITNWE